MDTLPIAIIGCGGMGRRHLRGLATLQASDFNNVSLAAVCDLHRPNAEDLADEAEQLLGTRPQVCERIEELAAVDGLRGCDITTDAGSHHRVATRCLEAGLHVQVEKPLSLTIRGCDAIIAAARERGLVLSVAENYRRDPINRLARALLVDGAIGTLQFMLEVGVGGGKQIAITPWRHHKLTGTIVMDAGIHNADIMLYYLGDVVTAYGEGRITQPIRYRAAGEGGPGGFYAKWSRDFPEQLEATGEDALFGSLHFASGALGTWIAHRGAIGHSQGQRTVYGSNGSLSSPGDRQGAPLTVHVDGRTITDGAMLDLAPSYRLPPLEAVLFGGERVWRYDGPFNEIDWKILAQEYHEFATCVLTGTTPEVTGEVGRRTVALVNALFESGLARRAVTLDEVEAGAVDAYQREIDEHFGLV